MYKRRAFLAPSTLASALAVAALAPGCSDSSSGGDDDAPGTDDDGTAGDGTADDGTADDADGSGDSDDGVVASDRWTILVYGHADHNLSPSLVADMLEMSEATLSEDVTVIVMADWDASQPDFAEGTEWYRMTGGGAAPELLETVPEQDLDDPNILSAAITRAFTEWPADHHGLIMWDHGGSWEGGFGGDSNNGEGHGAGLRAAPLADAIAAGMADAQVEQLRFLSFDTCLMAGVEVLAELSSLSELFIANAEIDYGAGWDYQATLSWLSANPDADTLAFAEAESAQWNAHHEAMGAEDALLRSHASIDTAGVAAFVEAFAAFNDTFVASESMAGEDVGRAAFFALPGYFADSVSTLAQTPNLRDVGQFLDAMVASNDDAIASAALAARGALDDTIVASVHGSLRQAVGQAGVHIELPPAASVPWRIDDYIDLAPQWVAATGWSSGLEHLESLSDAEAPEVVTDLEVEPGALVFFSDATDVAVADISTAIIDPQDDDRAIVLGLVGSGMVEPGFEYSFAWDGTLLEMGSGDQAQPVAVLPFARTGVSNGDSLPILGVPGFLGGDGEEYEALLPFQVGDATVDTVIISTGDGTTAVVPLMHAVGLQFTPATPTVQVSTGESQTQEGIAIDIPESGALTLGETEAPAGDYLLITSVLDVWGNSAPVVDQVVLR